MPRIFRTYYKDKNGQRTQAKKWYIDFTDHLQIRRRWPGFESKRQTEALAQQIERMIACKMAGEKPDAQLTRWLEGIPPRLLKQIVAVGLLDSHRAAAGKPLREHLADFKKHLLAKGNTASHVDIVVTRAGRIIDGCKFRNWSDISASKIQGYLASLREIGQGISAQTFNFYLQAIKQFCKWMVSDRRATESPVEHLKRVNVRIDRRHDRRAFEPDEIRRLLEATTKAQTSFGMAGYERAMLYRLAVETGLRRSELQSLKVSSFDCHDCTVTVEAAYSKNRKQCTLPLRKETASAFQGFLANKLPTAPVFHVPKKTAKMLKADLEAVGIPYVDDAGRYADFHALRHTTGSWLAAMGVHPKLAQVIMRHSDINLTMSWYTYLFAGQEITAIESLPDLSI